MQVLLDEAMLEMLSSLGNPGEPNPLVEILEVYRDDGARVLAELQAATSAADSDQVRRSAHRLKGSSANLGAKELAVVLGRIEAAAPTGVTPEIVADVALVPELFQRTLAGIEAYCG